MSRLDSFIARMQAQRDCLNFLKPAVDRLGGPILEIGLGKRESLREELGPAVDVMTDIKLALDRRWIMNPNKIFKPLGHFN